MKTREFPRFKLGLLLALLALALDSGCVSKTRNGESTAAPSTPVAPAAVDHSAKIPEMCAKLDASIAKYKWGLQTCDGIGWKSDRLSEEGRPLIYAEFGNPESPNKTLILSMVHPDEITPLYLGFKLVHYFKAQESELKDAHVIVAPFVNPDGHFRDRPSRLNARGVDLNRNFDTPLWREKALKTWNTTLKKNPRRFPGHEPSSESETKFQEELLARFKPTKVLSFHSPLNVMDYDGPTSLTLDRFPREYVRACYRLRAQVRAKHTGFFPGSLGNYAGIEMGIPTITLELPSADPARAAGFWQKFRPGIQSMVQFKIGAGEQAPSP